MTGSMWLRRCRIHFQPKRTCMLTVRKDMHVDDSVLFLQIDKMLSEVMG